MGMDTSEKIRLLARRKKIKLGTIAELIGQTRQTLGTKLRSSNFKESELSAIAEILGCDMKITFVDKESGEEL